MLIVEVIIVEEKPPRPMLIVEVIIVEATIGMLIAEAIPMLQEWIIHQQETVAWEFTFPLTLAVLQQRCRITL